VVAAASRAGLTEQQRLSAIFEMSLLPLHAQERSGDRSSTQVSRPQLRNRPNLLYKVGGGLEEPDAGNAGRAHSEWLVAVLPVDPTKRDHRDRYCWQMVAKFLRFPVVDRERSLRRSQKTGPADDRRQPARLGLHRLTDRMGWRLRSESHLRPRRFAARRTSATGKELVRR
jgi:hypothetical protein